MYYKFILTAEEFFVAMMNFGFDFGYEPICNLEKITSFISCACTETASPHGYFAKNGERLTSDVFTRSEAYAKLNSLIRTNTTCFYEDVRIRMEIDSILPAGGAEHSPEALN